MYWFRVCIKKFFIVQPACLGTQEIFCPKGYFSVVHNHKYHKQISSKFVIFVHILSIIVNFVFFHPKCQISWCRSFFVQNESVVSLVMFYCFLCHPVVWGGLWTPCAGVGGILHSSVWAACDQITEAVHADQSGSATAAGARPALTARPAARQLLPPRLRPGLQHSL